MGADDASDSSGTVVADRVHDRQLSAVVRSPTAMTTLFP